MFFIVAMPDTAIAGSTSLTALFSGSVSSAGSPAVLITRLVPASGISQYGM